MLLLVITIISVAVFCVYHGYILAGIICLGGFFGKIGFIALLITSIMLFVKGHWVVSALPILLIGINLLFMDKRKIGMTVSEDEFRSCVSADEPYNLANVADFISLSTPK